MAADEKERPWSKWEVRALMEGVSRFGMDDIAKLKRLAKLPEDLSEKEIKNMCDAVLLGRLPERPRSPPKTKAQSSSPESQQDEETKGEKEQASSNTLTRRAKPAEKLFVVLPSPASPASASPAGGLDELLLDVLWAASSASGACDGWMMPGLFGNAGLGTGVAGTLGVREHVC